jgi:hypothetical protein
MPVTVRNADILFNDGTTQTTAAGAVTTTQVLNATAAAAVGAVGSYAFLAPPSPTGFVSNFYFPGTTVAGSNLRYAGVGYDKYGSYSPAVPNISTDSTPSGTWRCMGFSIASSNDAIGTRGYHASLFLRIS